MRTIYLFTCMLLLTHSLMADEKQLYLISGYPTRDFEYTYPCSMFSIDNEKITFLYDIFDIYTGTAYIRAYQDERLLIVAKASAEVHLRDSMTFEEYLQHSSKSPNIKIIDMNNPLKIKDKYDNFVVDSHYTYLIRIDNVNYFATHFPSKNGNQFENEIGYTLIGINMETNVSSNLPFQYILQSKISGQDLIHINRRNELVIGAFSDGKLINFISRAYFPYKIPEKYRFKGKYNEMSKLDCTDSLKIIFENDHFRVFHSERLIQKYESQYPLIIYDKKNNSWNEIVHDEIIEGVKGYKHWFAGHVRSNGNVESYGKERRSYLNYNIWKSFDRILTQWNRNVKIRESPYYFKGLLFIYNITSNEKYILDTNQGDSEILLIENDDVYYRVYDEIYKADITDEGIVNNELLVKDERVPDIHWAFLN